MAGSDHDGARRLVRHHSVAHRGCGRGAVAEHHRNSTRGHHLGCGGGELGGEKPRIVANNQAPRGLALPANILRHCCGHTPHVGECKILADNSAPPVRSKFDFIHGNSPRALDTSRAGTARHGNQSPSQDPAYNNLCRPCRSSSGTALPTFWESSREQTSSASSVSTMTRL